MTTFGENRKRRGSALIMAYFAVVMLAFMVVYGYQSTTGSGAASQTIADSEGADYAAEYGANLAMSGLANVSKYDDGTIRDWVNENTVSPASAVDTRVIGGNVEGYQFNVQVRSARDAFTQGTAPNNWLADKYTGSAPIRNRADYTNTYEIISTASRPGVDEQSQSVPRTSNRLYGVVDMALLNNPGNELQNYNSAYLADNLSQLTVETEVLPPPVMARGTIGGVYAYASLGDCVDGVGNTINKNTGGIEISGEDHYLTTVFPTLTVATATEVLGAQRGIVSDGKFVAATGGYWRAGTLTLNFMSDDRPVDPIDLRTVFDGTRRAYTPARPNPHVPRSVSFGTTLDAKMMMSKATQSGLYSNNSAFGVPANDMRPSDMLTPATAPLDQYFLGGKTGSVPAYVINGSTLTVSGRTITFTDPDLYTRDYPPNDSRYFNNVIVETNNAQATTDRPLDVIVGSYDQLKRFYTTHRGGIGNIIDSSNWRTTFVGQWTKEPRRPLNSGSTIRNMLFDHNNVTARRRTFSKHFPTNKEGKILVHEMVMSNGAKQTSSSQTPTTWTGRYRWADVDFTGKFSWKEKGTNFLVYPREFTWEEVTGQKSRRIQTGTGVSLSVSGVTLERVVNKKTGAVTYTETIGVILNGYPVCDSLDREVSDIDDEGNHIPVGLTEYCSVEPTDPRVLKPVSYGTATAFTSTLCRMDIYGVHDVVRNSSKFARRNYIEVVEDDGTIGYYDKISDFEYLNEVTVKDDDGIEHSEERKMATIIIGIEDLPEASVGGLEASDFDYTDMMFVLNVVPSANTATTLLGENTDSSRFIQWWVLDSDHGLTGGDAISAVSSTELPGTSLEQLSEAERQRVNFEAMFRDAGDLDGIVTFIGTVDGVEKLYHRAVFDENGNLIMPDFADDEEKKVYYYAAYAAGSSVADAKEDRVYHSDKYDDLFAYMNIMMENEAPELEGIEDNNQRKVVALAKMEDACANVGVTLHDISERLTDISVDGVGYLLKGSYAMGDDRLYKVREERYTARRQAGLIFGGDGVTVPVVNTGTLMDGGGEYVRKDNIISSEQHLFIAGELPPNASIPIHFNDVTMLQPENSPVADEGRPNPLLLDAYHGIAGSNDDFETHMVVDQLYQHLLPPHLQSEIYDAFSIDDNRYQLGWHRSGSNPDAVANTNLLLDCYRAAILTAQGIQPYALARSDYPGEQKIVAKVETLIGTKDDDTEVFDHLTHIDKAGNLPTFTFTARNGAGFDGAGVLVVNGNLRINTEFSYYGVLIVLGDVFIEPAKDWYYAKDSSGNFLSVDNEKIYRDSDGRWFRMLTKTNEEEVEEGEEPLYWREKDYNDQSGNPVEPAITEQFKGALTVQGKMLVGGNTTITYGTDTDYECNNTYVYNGSLKVLSSSTAVDDVMGAIGDGDGNALGYFGTNKAVWKTQASQ